MTVGTMPAHWENWAGNVQAAPRRVTQPASLEELRTVLRESAARGETVRVAGAGHSFAPLCATDGTVVDLSLLAGIERVDPETGEATIWAGTRLFNLGGPLLEAGRALLNQGDIDRQAVAGAVSTGTHGTGRKHGSFSAMVRAIELMRADGELVTIDGSDPEQLRAAALSLGLLGVVTRVTLATAPAYKLREHNEAMTLEECLERFLATEESRRNAEFWWLPAYDTAVIKTLSETEEEPFHEDLPEAAPGTLERYLRADYVDWSWRAYPSQRDAKFVEIEYTLPLSEGPAALREACDLVRTKYPDCTWAVEFRTQPGENPLLSPTHGGESATISLHQAIEKPHEAFFRDAEPIFLAHGGRPHWGKVQFLDAAQIAALYPEQPAFEAIRREMDPGGLFVNDYLRRLGFGS
ncbi:MAG: FAD-binding protein [Thermomicrobiales bacterium]|nr:FAD-binding protein [Thermomicrobiales bacterium]